MKSKLLLFALFALLLLPSLAMAGEPAPSQPEPPAANPQAATAPGPALVLPTLATPDCAVAKPTALAFSPISSSLVCEGVSYPGCFPGGSCQDPCCYCQCRADGGGAGICSFECCLGH